MMDELDLEGFPGVMILRDKGFHLRALRGAIMFLVGPRIRDCVYQQPTVPPALALRSTLAWAPPTTALVTDDWCSNSQGMTWPSRPQLWACARYRRRRHLALAALRGG